MKPSIRVRALTADDASAFLALRLRGLMECPEAFASSHAEEVLTPLAEVVERLKAKPDQAILGAFEGTTLLGIVGLKREEMKKLAHKAYIWGLYVAPEARGRRTGALVLRAALAYARSSLGVRQVNLGVNTNNVAAIALYKKLGFVEYGLERNFLAIDGAGFDEYLMARVLTEADAHDA